MPIPQHARADACPGVLATHQAADGALARVRLPGGRVSARQLRALGDCADEHCDGVLYLTSRANIQLRGLAPDAEKPLAATLSQQGLLPAPGHERVRNYLASPASGYFGGYVDVRPLVAALDDAVCARPELAALAGRFLFALDDGRGDVSGMDSDVCWQALGETGRLLVGGVDTGLCVDTTDAVEALVRCAEEFSARRGDVWRVHELPGAVAALAAAAADMVSRPAGQSVDTWPRDSLSESRGHVSTDCEPECDAPQPGPNIGRSEQDDGRVAICTAPVLGELTTEQARVLAGESDGLVITPWRTVLVPDIDPVDADAVLSRFADVELRVDPAAAGLGVSACIGKPGCAKAHADVRTRAKALLPLLPTGTRAHFAGCERRCGKPREPHTDVLATEDGYRLDGTWLPTESLEESLSAAHRQREGHT